MKRRSCLQATVLVAALVVCSQGLAHHGWSWTTGENVRLTGTIAEVRLGYPHGELTLDVDGAAYTVEVGQPWRNQRAGLGEGDFAPGRQMTVQGEVASDPDARVLKVERLWIDGERYELYPERD